jgi:polar amino acid transport system substrate-binding protein
MFRSRLAAHGLAVLGFAALAAAPAPEDPRAAPTTPRVVTICSDPWMPYAGESGAGADEGYVVALARAALQRGGYQVRYVVAPWSRCIADVQAGRWDAIACVDAREVPDAVYPEEPVGETRPSFFVRRDSKWRYQGLASLEEIRLGAIQGYAYADEVDGWIKAHAGDDRHLFLASGTEPLRRLFEMLEAGRLDAIIESPLVAAWTAHRLGRPSGPLREVGVVGPLVPIYLAFSRRTPDGAALARAFDAGLRALRAEGKVAPLLARYGVPAWQRPGARAP